MLGTYSFVARLAILYIYYYPFLFFPLLTQAFIYRFLIVAGISLAADHSGAHPEHSEHSGAALGLEAFAGESYSGRRPIGYTAVDIYLSLISFFCIKYVKPSA